MGHRLSSAGRRRSSSPAAARLLAAAGLALLAAAPAQASFFEGETVDKIAEVLSWVVLVVVPVVAVVAFWLVHILPEKIAEKRRHPQAKAIQCLCLLSLFFGGLLWPLAWLWAYSKPVLHKIAYGVDVAEAHEHGTAPSLSGELEANRPHVAAAPPERRVDGAPAAKEQGA